MSVASVEEKAIRKANAIVTEHYSMPSEFVGGTARLMMTKMGFAMTSTIVLEYETRATYAMATALAVSDAPIGVPRIMTLMHGSTMAVVFSRVAAILLQRIIGFVIPKSHVLTMGVVGIGPKAAPIRRLAIGTPTPWWKMVRAITRGVIWGALFPMPATLMSLQLMTMGPVSFTPV